jgi:hypothetical protein
VLFVGLVGALAVWFFFITAQPRNAVRSICYLAVVFVPLAFSGFPMSKFFQWRPRARTKSPNLSTRSTQKCSHSVFRQTLTILNESADAFPPLKSAVGGALAIVELVEVRSPYDTGYSTNDLTYYSKYNPTNPKPVASLNAPQSSLNY